MWFLLRHRFSSLIAANRDKWQFKFSHLSQLQLALISITIDYLMDLGVNYCWCPAFPIITTHPSVARSHQKPEIERLNSSPEGLSLWWRRKKVFTNCKSFPIKKCEIFIKIMASGSLQTLTVHALGLRLDHRSVVGVKLKEGSEFKSQIWHTKSFITLTYTHKQCMKFHNKHHFLCIPVSLPKQFQFQFHTA